MHCIICIVVHTAVSIVQCRPYFLGLLQYPLDSEYSGRCTIVGGHRVQDKLPEARLDYCSSRATPSWLWLPTHHSRPNGMCKGFAWPCRLYATGSWQPLTATLNIALPDMSWTSAHSVLFIPTRPHGVKEYAAYMHIQIHMHMHMHMHTRRTTNSMYNFPTHTSCQPVWTHLLKGVGAMHEWSSFFGCCSCKNLTLSAFSTKPWCLRTSS